MQEQDTTTTARSEAAVRELKIQMLEASGPHTAGAVWAIVLHFAIEQMSPEQYDRWRRFALAVLDRAIAEG